MRSVQRPPRSPQNFATHTFCQRIFTFLLPRRTYEIYHLSAITIPYSYAARDDGHFYLMLPTSVRWH